jgi:hypothetical protein
MVRIMDQVNINQAFEVASTPTYQAEKPVRNDLYRRLIKRFPCVVCGATRNVDPCHTGTHGMSQKESSVLSCVRLRRKCHDQFDGGSKGFPLRHHVNVPAAIHKFDHTWGPRKRRTV